MNRFNCTTSIDDGITKYGVAVSQDLLKQGVVHYGDVLYVPGYGYKIVNDCMGPRNHSAIDLLVFSRTEEKQVGTRHLPVFVIPQTHTSFFAHSR